MIVAAAGVFGGWLLAAPEDVCPSLLANPCFHLRAVLCGWLDARVRVGRRRACECKGGECVNMNNDVYFTHILHTPAAQSGQHFSLFLASETAASIVYSPPCSQPDLRTQQARISSAALVAEHIPGSHTHNTTKQEMQGKERDRWVGQVAPIATR